MGKARQTTVARPAEAEGIGLHSGQQVRVRLNPAAADAGLFFIRTDLPGAPTIRVAPEFVRREALRRRTELGGEDGAIVATAEHLLAACLALGLDNARVELDGPELPIFDGSAGPYAGLVREAGLKKVEAPRRAWRLARAVTLVKEHAEMAAIPAERMGLAFFAELRHAGMVNQSVRFQLGKDSFEERLAAARTFCFFEEVEGLREAGLIRGGSMDCAIVLRDGRPMDGDYRMPNELACHKMVDLLGDLATLGRPVKALITARGSGHAMHHEFIELMRKELIDDLGND
jgi:UDP-3-O-[3-hydroxymyristoyl] N-acetylglucosamine deacetylase